MELGVVGLPKSGKTTAFNALTGGKAETSAFAGTQAKANLAVVKVPDERLATLDRLFKPRRVVPAEIRYVDFPTSPKGLGRTEGIAGSFLLELSQVDALLHVVRAFEDPSLPHAEGSVDPFRDIATMDLELIMSDLSVIDRRLQKLQSSLKVARTQEREAINKEAESLSRIKSQLEKEVPLRDQELSQDDSRLLSGFQLLTAKPMLVLLNIDEASLERRESLETELQKRYRSARRNGTVVCGKLEAELAQLSLEEGREFGQAMGIHESGMAKMIRLSYQLLGLISFFTVGSDEVRAWTIAQGTAAPHAAGKVHSDMEKGFIRAEVVAYKDMARCGSIAAARQQGVLRTEGKTYTVQDGDVITFLFNS